MRSLRTGFAGGDRPRDLYARLPHVHGPTETERAASVAEEMNMQKNALLRTCLRRYQSDNLAALVRTLRELGQDDAFTVAGALPNKTTLENHVRALGDTDGDDLPPLSTTYGLVLLSLLASRPVGSPGGRGDFCEEVAGSFLASGYAPSKARLYITDLNRSHVSPCVRVCVGRACEEERERAREAQRERERERKRDRETERERERERERKREREREI